MTAAGRVRLATAVLVGCALATVAEWALRPHPRPDHWIPDVAVGVLFIVLGGLQGRDDRARRQGDLLVLAGVAWFLPNFAASSLASLAWMAGHSWALHRAVLLHAVLASPAGRLRSMLPRVAVLVGYVGSLLPAAGTPAGMVIGGLFIGGACWLTPRRDDDGWRVTRLVGTGYGAVVVLTGLARGLGEQVGQNVVSLMYDLGLVTVGVLLVWATRRELARLDRRADALLEIALGPEESVRAMLVESFGDPSITVAYATAGATSPHWVDELGRPVAAPVIADGRSRAIKVNDEVVAVVTSERRWLDGPDVERFADAVATVASRHVMLRARLRDDATALEASRRRLLAADDDARLGFALELAGGTSASLLQVHHVIAPLAGEDVPGPVGSCVASANEQLALARSELSRFAAGLGPFALVEGGLDSALQSLVASGPTPVQLEVDVGDLPHDVAVGAYFVCAEAVTNAWKHAGASAIGLQAHRSGEWLTLVVTDDGRGGADRGSGLAQLEDRVVAMGGVLSVASAAGGGTRLTAELPVGVPGGQPAPVDVQPLTRTQGTPKT